jgi:ribosomal protein S18 acetylase RimI-like enzyme
MVSYDVDFIRDIELRAGARFRSIAEPRIARCAEDAPFTAEELAHFIDAERAWIVVDGGVIAGFVVADVIDEHAHVEEIAVLPEFGGRGHGAALLDELQRWTVLDGLKGLTLTTFRDVPWNRPWYEHLGFRVLDESEWTAGLRAVRDAEDADGLPAELRVVMRRMTRLT